jgi:hypothetical protein
MQKFGIFLTGKSLRTVCRIELKNGNPLYARCKSDMLYHSSASWRVVDDPLSKCRNDCNMMKFKRTQ